jgi:hypothetical protein
MPGDLGLMRRERLLVVAKRSAAQRHSETATNADGRRLRTSASDLTEDDQRAERAPTLARKANLWLFFGYFGSRQQGQRENQWAV